MSLIAVVCSVSTTDIDCHATSLTVSVPDNLVQRRRLMESPVRISWWKLYVGEMSTGSDLGELACYTTSRQRPATLAVLTIRSSSSLRCSHCGRLYGARPCFQFGSVIHNSLVSSQGGSSCKHHLVLTALVHAPLLLLFIVYHACYAPCPPTLRRSFLNV